MATPGVHVSTDGIGRATAARLRQRVKDAEQARQRAIATLKRRLNTETVRVIAGEILNLPQSKVRPSIRVQGNDKVVTVSASRTRLPLSDYKPRVSKGKGAVATTWRDAGPKAYPHAFLRRDKPGVWQRIPAGSRLVGRLPIVQLKGPDIHRVFLPEGTKHAHGNVAKRLAQVAHNVLAAEIERLMKRNG